MEQYYELMDQRLEKLLVEMFGTQVYAIMKQAILRGESDSLLKVMKAYLESMDIETAETLTESMEGSLILIARDSDADYRVRQFAHNCLEMFRYLNR